MKIAIAGYGQEGEQNYLYYSRDPNNQLTIVDEKQSPDRLLPEGVPTILGEGAFSKLDGFDLVIRTAGLSPAKIQTNGKIWSATNEFFAKCPAKIVGVTGTKGKGTTASMIASMLESAGKKVWLVGNIGKPSLSVIDEVMAEDIVVYELSSFQLWDIDKSPNIAVITMIEQDHLDIHSDFDDYLIAKSNIVKYQSADDVVIYNNLNKYASAIASNASGRRVGYQDKSSIRVHDGYFWAGDTKLFSLDNLQLVGLHNIENACGAILAALQFTDDIDKMALGLASFKGLEHRLRFVDEVRGVKYYDDSISTTPGSAVAALKSFEGHKIIILGGSRKGSDFSELAEEMTKQDVFAFLIGQESTSIAAAFEMVGFMDFEILQTISMQDIVENVYKKASIGDVVLLSPAAASFGMFKNYVDRGNQFIESIKNLKNNEVR